MAHDSLIYEPVNGRLLYDPENDQLIYGDNCGCCDLGCEGGVSHATRGWVLDAGLFQMR